MVDDNFGFRDDEERKEFYIALPVIALFGVMLYYFVFASDDNASLVSSATATAAFTDSDIDGIADHLDRCVDEKGTIENHGCLVAQTSEEAPTVKSQPVSIKQSPVTKAQAVSLAEPIEVENEQQVELIQPETTQAAPENNASAELTQDVADADADGIADAEDACPEIAGTDEGCPADKDADGVSDDTDACPDQAGTDNGCPSSTTNSVTPEEPVSESEEQLLLDAGFNLQFNAGNAVLAGRSREILMEVALVMQRNPEIKLEAHGFTDALGSADSNKELSQQRAQACIDVIIEAGIDPERLKAKGFGEAQPIATNDTAEGRQKNRRVEFKLIP